jgi:hypothetical protein
MPNTMLLLSKAVPAKVRHLLESPLPLRVSELADCELLAHCDRCGRHLRLHPGPVHLRPQARLADLLDSLRCTARRQDRSCGGLPRRLILIREERQWVLEADGDWTEDTSAYWEEADFEAISARPL